MKVFLDAISWLVPILLDKTYTTIVVIVVKRSILGCRVKTANGIVVVLLLDVAILELSVSVRHVSDNR